MYNIIQIEPHTTDTEYQENILKVFDLTEFNERITNQEIDHIFTQLKTHPDFIQLEPILKQLASHFLSEELALGFVIMFSYDYFYITHQIICDFLSFNIINDFYIEKIKHLIENGG